MKYHATSKRRTRSKRLSRLTWAVTVFLASWWLNSFNKKKTKPYALLLNSHNFHYDVVLSFTDIMHSLDYRVVLSTLNRHGFLEYFTQVFHEVAVIGESTVRIKMCDFQVVVFITADHSNDPYIEIISLCQNPPHVVFVLHNVYQLSAKVQQMINSQSSAVIAVFTDFAVEAVKEAFSENVRADLGKIIRFKPVFQLRSCRNSSSDGLNQAVVVVGQGDRRRRNYAIIDSVLQDDRLSSDRVVLMGRNVERIIEDWNSLSQNRIKLATPDFVDFWCSIRDAKLILPLANDPSYYLYKFPSAMGTSVITGVPVATNRLLARSSGLQENEYVMIDDENRDDLIRVITNREDNFASMAVALQRPRELWIAENVKQVGSALRLSLIHI